MLMTANLLADRLSEQVGSRIIPDDIPGFSTIEYVRPSTRFVPGRAYLLDAPPAQVPPAGCVLLTGREASFAAPAGCAVIEGASGADELYAAALDELEKYRRFEQGLITALESNCDIQAFIEQAARYLQNQLIVVDRSLAVLAVSSIEPRQADKNLMYIMNNRRLPEEVVSRLAPLYQQTKRSKERVQQRLAKGTALYGIPNVHVDLTDGGVFLGWLILVGCVSPLTAGTLELLDQLALPAAHLMAVHQAGQKPDLAFDEYYWREWLAGRLDSPSLTDAMLRARGWQKEDRFRVSQIVEAGPETAAFLSAACPGCLILPGEEALTVVECRPANQEQTWIDWAQMAGQSRALVGTSDDFPDAGRLPDLIRQATLATRRARAQPASPVCRFADIALDCWLADSEERLDRLLFLHPAVHRLKRPDAGKQRKLARSLLTYLEYERQLSAAADQLFIHKNTLLYRISSLTEALELNLDDPRERLRLLISLKMLLMDESENL